MGEAAKASRANGQARTGVNLIPGVLHEREGHGWRVSYVWVVESEGGTSEGEILCHV